MSDWADEIGLDICGPLPHAKYVASALRQERGKSHIAGLREAAEMLREAADQKEIDADDADDCKNDDGYMMFAHASVCLRQQADAILARIAELEKP